MVKVYFICFPELKVIDVPDVHSTTVKPLPTATPSRKPNLALSTPAGGESSKLIVTSTKNNNLLTTQPPNKQTCGHSKLYSHVTLKGGLTAGDFRRLAEFSTMKECARKCCASPTCDVAIMMKDTCFELHCHSRELCETRPARLRNFNLVMMYIHRDKGTTLC